MKDDRIYLLHIRDAIDRILTYMAGGRSEFFNEVPRAIGFQFSVRRTPEQWFSSRLLKAITDN